MAAEAPVAFDLVTALYIDEPMSRIWSADTSIANWLRVESALADAQALYGVIERADADAIMAACDPAAIDPRRLWADAAVVGYPILPLVRQITAQLDGTAAGRVHYGATTQDIMDSALALQLGQSIDRLLGLLDLLGSRLAHHVQAHASTPMAGRTHAQQAVPTTFGAKMAVFLEEARHRIELLDRQRPLAARVSLFGAGGTSAAMGASSGLIRTAVAGSLGLAAEDIPWHVARGGILGYGQALGSISALCVRLAREVIDLSRTEIAEVREQSGHHRGASSTMPQKANPIYCEAVVGLGATVGAMGGALLRAAEAGHERSAGEWQIEWLVLPSLSVYTATAVTLMTQVLEGLQVFPERMRSNLSAEHGLIMSEAAMMRLAPVRGREHAHDAVYAAARQARADDIPLDAALRQILPAGQIEAVGELAPDEYLGEADVVCARALDSWNTSQTNRHKGSAAR
jgi:3-carboxy-cis,cis-muconate cycloisomerase